MQNKNIKIVALHNEDLKELINLLKIKITTLKQRKGKAIKYLENIKSCPFVVSAKEKELIFEIAIYNVQILDYQKLLNYMVLFYEKE